jgi:RNA polymerase-interacting CarD/CdnL/TRCF family regulator
MREPALRASDDDRDAVLRALERHTAEGRINLDEFDQRCTAALTAVSLDDLAALTADLPQLSDEPAQPVEPASRARHVILLFVIAFITLGVLVAMMLLHP